jgi:hypothetical protein
MLHIKAKSDDDVFIKLENGLCKCYMKTESDDVYQEVGELYVNVTSKQNLKVMMMIFIKLENCCLCECYSSNQKVMMMYLSSG